MLKVRDIWAAMYYVSTIKRIQLITIANDLLRKQFELFAKSNNCIDINFKQWKIFLIVHFIL